MSKAIVFSGIQPTGNLHIGNYLGAVKNWVTIQNSGKYDCHFCIVDYHSLTGDRSAQERREATRHLAAELIAAGIDPDKSTFFVQSFVPEHTELAWIFNSITPMAELERMTQYKDKSQRQVKNVNVGLFTYPALMAADILLYGTTHVPVGEDQLQHVELTRDTARWFNNRYGEYFSSVEPILTKIPRVKSLLEPTAKMSKSKGEGHVIELADEPNVIEKKIKKAVTASEPGQESPGVKNLLLLLEEFAPSELHQQFVAAQKDGSIRYGDLKQELGKAISSHFESFRARRRELLDKHDELAEILIRGAEQAQQRARETMQEVRTRIGVR